MNRFPHFVDVAVPLPIFQTFTYEVPDSIQLVRPGARLLVPLGKRSIAAIALRLHREPPAQKFRQVEKVLDSESVISEPLLELAQWISSYYFSPLGEAIRIMLPPGLLQKKNADRAPAWPVKQRWMILEVLNGGGGLTARQAHVMDVLSAEKLPVELTEFVRKTDCSAAVVKKLAHEGRIVLQKVSVYRSPWGDAAPRLEKHILNDEQQKIFETLKHRLQRGGFYSVLLHGVTGSGKTEIYLNAIAFARSLGKSALMMVPEIGLTPQVARQFRSWFGEEVAILHSALSDGERFDEWRRIREGEAQVVVGTRSAVFAPLAKLGIIIVDEEHDSSYKQEEMPRYHGRDTALKRASIEGALVLLGSATPQLETFFQAVESRRFDYMPLPFRILERPLPTVHIVDMRVEFERKGKAAVLCDLLKENIADRLTRREQVLVLMNRRGYSSVLLCRSCGNTEACANCSINLTYHQESSRLSCHYCGYARSVPQRCRSCGKEYIYFLGEGTEQIQKILMSAFPNAITDRLDRDSVQRRGSYDRILGSFSSGKTDILIGTQMIAKGHDFPRVTLVGVLAAEQMLRLADFRAAEKTFQLVTQVAGRAGRGEQPGEVIIQTHFPNHYSLRYACAQDYRRFYDQEVRYRRDFRYPPFTALANLLVHSTHREKAAQLASRIGDVLKQKIQEHSHERRMRLLGPSPAAIERIKREFRFQMLIKTTSRRELHEVLDQTFRVLQQEGTSLKNILVDVDPITVL
ncbi:MAG: primosomal protein N' [Acidobacteria bacterium]|nr:primosomal protein N' [Acidobacteriota bacterium]